MFHSVRFHREQSHVVCRVLECYWLFTECYSSFALGNLNGTVLCLRLFSLVTIITLSTLPRTLNHPSEPYSHPYPHHPSTPPPSIRPKPIFTRSSAKCYRAALMEGEFEEEWTHVYECTGSLLFT